MGLTNRKNHKKDPEEDGTYIKPMSNLYYHRVLR